ncbi:hypothetical protein RHGRI_013627 [Rhododendron griersonianum]|uniref:ADP-ribosylation factor n=1 Tax=Rhododendron griersonianum TaxID=479676 RepID=A0AAV6K6N0_9ERIC|nr:hypothetical protein RHGRI_013627 [Rhododendron griersonianum]
MDMDVPPEEYTSTLTVSDISTAPSASPRHAPITQVYTRRPTSTAAPQSASTDPDPPVRRYPLRDNRQPPVVMLGLDAAGKTTILYKLCIEEVLLAVPTIGVPFINETVWFIIVVRKEVFLNRESIFNIVILSGHH